MRINIRHDTSYTYAAPARSALQLLRLTPRSTASQFVRRWRVEVDADARLDRSEDAFGNITHVILVDGPLTHLQISVTGEVNTHDTGGIVSGTVERLPAAFYMRDTALTRASPAIRRFARDILAAEGGDMLRTLHTLNDRLFGDMQFDVSATTSTTTADQAFTKKAGVCQDFAHIIIAAARAIGCPARYVNGYFLRTDRDDQEAGHAWAEVFVNGLGWIGFDPAHGLCTTESHVRVAIGSDSCDAAPVRGTQLGGQDEQLAVSIEVSRGRRMVEE